MLIFFIGLSPGDSGSWVVGEGTGSVYGHVVSIDAFGEGQVMPISLTLESIRVQLDAVRVWLPTRADVRTAMVSRQMLPIAPSSEPSFISDYRRLLDHRITLPPLDPQSLGHRIALPSLDHVISRPIPNTRITPWTGPPLRELPPGLSTGTGTKRTGTDSGYASMNSSPHSHLE